MANRMANKNVYIEIPKFPEDSRKFKDFPSPRVTHLFTPSMMYVIITSAAITCFSSKLIIIIDAYFFSLFTIRATHHE